MCDTFIALGSATRDGGLVFGKNSDRPAGEVQRVESHPGRYFPAGITVDCSHVAIPQVARTLATIISRPDCMWGAEMGANEAGVVIGNEAVFTNQPCAEPALTGMDLLRLALERASSAAEALECIVDLMDAHGQGGPCGASSDLTYSSSFLIADWQSAWVLETAGQMWIAEAVDSTVRSISNNLSIGGQGSRRHPDLDGQFVVDGRRWPELDFASLFTSFADDVEVDVIYQREAAVRSHCRRIAGEFDIEAAQTILRDHEGQICMHRDRFETRGSQVSRVTANGAQHWFCEGPFPCRQEYMHRRFATTASGRSGPAATR